MSKSAEHDVLDRLTQDLIWAYYDVDEYVVLFGENPGQRHLMMHTASHFFRVLHRYYWDRFTMYISRITDFPRTKQNDNLSIVRAKTLFPGVIVDRDAIDQDVEAITTRAKNFRSIRDKTLAHRDLETALDGSTQMQPLALEDVVAILEANGRILNHFHLALHDTTLSWHTIKTDSAETLLFWLREGAVYAEMKDRRRDWRLDRDERQQSEYGSVELNNSKAVYSSSERRAT